jgi:hypothetical protein
LRFHDREELALFRGHEQLVRPNARLAEPGFDELAADPHEHLRRVDPRVDDFDDLFFEVAQFLGRLVFQADETDALRCRWRGGRGLKPRALTGEELAERLVDERLVRLGAGCVAADEVLLAVLHHLADLLPATPQQGRGASERSYRAEEAAAVHDLSRS